MKTCFFIGHRDAPENAYEHLLATVEQHIVEYGMTDFVIGRYGSFDRLATRTLIQAKQLHPEIRMTLLLAYYDPFKPFVLPQGFDDSLYPLDASRGFDSFFNAFHCEILSAMTNQTHVCTVIKVLMAFYLGHHNILPIFWTL